MRNGDSGKEKLPTIKLNRKKPSDEPELMEIALNLAYRVNPGELLHADLCFSDPGRRSLFPFPLMDPFTHHASLFKTKTSWTTLALSHKTQWNYSRTIHWFPPGSVFHPGQQ